MKIAEVIRSTAGNKCPRCHRGRVFENNNPYSFRNGLTMHKHCSDCGLRYEKETGFFYGAMYVSYGLVAGLFVLFFAADALWFKMEALSIASIFSAIALVIFPVNFRWSRIIWINLFVKYVPGIASKAQGQPEHERAIKV